MNKSLGSLVNRFGSSIVKTVQEDIGHHMIEWRNNFYGSSPCVLYPESADHVSEMINIIRSNNESIITQGGNTGLCAGATPQAESIISTSNVLASSTTTEYLLSTERMRNIRSIDLENSAITVDAGVTLLNVQDTALENESYFPLSLASEGTAHIGGTIATNAGGTGCIKYGNMRNFVLGLEYVTADGAIHSSLSPLRKDNTGYDLKQLIIGSEGTLAIITGATLKLYPKPYDTQTIMCLVESPSKAVEVLTALQHGSGGTHRGGETLSMFELIPSLGIQVVCSSIPSCRDPFSINIPVDIPYASTTGIDVGRDYWYLLIEFENSNGNNNSSSNENIIECYLEDLFKASLIVDGIIAKDLSQASALKALREHLSDASNILGASNKHDISLPIQQIPAFLKDADALVQHITPGARPIPFGHLGDGNLHYNVSQPLDMTRERFLEAAPAMAKEIHSLVVNKYEGSFSAEHGIGLIKIPDMLRFKKSEDLNMMRSIKRALDPFNLLNPGRVVPM